MRSDVVVVSACHKAAARGRPVWGETASSDLLPEKSNHHERLEVEYVDPVTGGAL